MMKSIIPAMIILAMTWKFPVMYGSIINWTPELDDMVLGIYFQTLPPDRRQEGRMEAQWLVQAPNFERGSVKKLQRRAMYLIEQKNLEWEQKSKVERDKLEEDLTRIANNINIHERSQAENEIFNELLKQKPEVHNEALLIRSVIHKWYKLNAWRWRELYSYEMEWTPQHIADLWYIANAVKSQKGDFGERIKSRWSEIYPEPKIRTASLKHKYERLKEAGYQPSQEEEAVASKKIHVVSAPEINKSRRGCRSKRWPKQWIADLLYIYEQNKNYQGAVASSLEERWSRLYGKKYPLSGNSLLQHARRLTAHNYVPDPDDMARAKERYESLPKLEILESKNRRNFKKPYSGQEAGIKICEQHAEEYLCIKEWPRQRCADVIYMYNQNKDFHRAVSTNLEDQWAKMYNKEYPLRGSHLMRYVKRLNDQNFVPTPEEMAKAKTKYEGLFSLDVDTHKGRTPSKRNRMKEPEIRMASHNLPDEHHQQIVTGNISAARISTGNEIQPQYMFDAQLSAPLHRDLHFNPGLHSDHRIKDPDNSSQEHESTSFNQNIPYRYYKGESSRSHAKTP